MTTSAFGSQPWRNCKPPVWRRVLVPADIHLHQLHLVIRVALGWTNSHLHAFELGGAYYQDASLDADILTEMGATDEKRVSLNQLLEAPKSRMRYDYDFGDSWEHEVTLEKILPAEPKGIYPRCLKGVRACPPEDVGGIWGYADFLQAMANPRHPEHAELPEWAGGDFDAEAFDLEAVNAELARFIKLRR